MNRSRLATAMVLAAVGVLPASAVERVSTAALEDDGEGRMSARDRRRHPHRDRTRLDLALMARAEAKRQRKAAKRANTIGARRARED